MFKTLRAKATFFVVSGAVSLIAVLVVSNHLQVKHDNEFVSFISSSMDQAKVKMSSAKKKIAIDTIIRVSNKTFATDEQKKYFVVLLAIESKFQKDVKSSAGAVGVAQIMPKYAKDFAELCGITDFEVGDLNDYELNMTLGACQFKNLLSSFNGNVALALVAYNAGESSKSVKQLQAMGDITNTESASYISKFLYLTEKIKIAVAKADTAKVEGKEEIINITD